MDIAWGHTGIWVGFAVSVLLLVPVILEFGKRNLPVLFGVVVFVLVLRGLSNQSPEMQSLWLQLKLLPKFIYSSLRPLLFGMLP